MKTCIHEWGANIHFGNNFPNDPTDWRFGCCKYRCKKCGTFSNSKEDMNMEAKFTKEPWRAGRGFNPNHIVSEDGSKLIAQVTHNSNLLPFEESDANRALILNAQRMFYHLAHIVRNAEAMASGSIEFSGAGAPEWMDEAKAILKDITEVPHVDAK